MSSTIIMGSTVAGPAGPARMPTVRLRWRARAVPALTIGELEAFLELLEDHALTSRIEVRERQQATAGGRTWRPVVLEINGGEAVDPEDVVQGFLGEVTALRLRTFGYAATVAVAPTGIELVVDDEEDVAIRLLGALQAVVRGRRNPALAFLASEWGVPSLILGLPVVASFVEVASGRDGLALESVGLAAVALVVWLWWLHARWRRRPVLAGRVAGSLRQEDLTVSGTWVGADGEALAEASDARRL